MSSRLSLTVQAQQVHVHVPWDAIPTTCRARSPPHPPTRLCLPHPPLHPPSFLPPLPPSYPPTLLPSCPFPPTACDWPRYRRGTPSPMVLVVGTCTVQQNAARLVPWPSRAVVLIDLGETVECHGPLDDLSIITFTAASAKSIHHCRASRGGPGMQPTRQCLLGAKKASFASLALHVCPALSSSSPSRPVHLTPHKTINHHRQPRRQPKPQHRHPLPPPWPPTFAFNTHSSMTPGGTTTTTTTT